MQNGTVWNKSVVNESISNKLEKKDDSDSIDGSKYIPTSGQSSATSIDADESELLKQQGNCR